MSSPELLIADPAPAIAIETFLKGEPITDFAPGHIHVVEFWATWCGPCAASIPHLTDLQRRHPAALILGIAVGWAELEDVQTFVRAWDDRIGYRIAVDRRPDHEIGRSVMRAAWCDAAYQQGVPTAFIVDGTGRIAWIGHPTDLDEPLAAVVEGRWDLAAAAEAHRTQLLQDKVREARALERAVRACADMGDRDGMLRVYDAAFTDEPALERTFGFGKFKQLVAGSEAAVAYGRHLITEVGADDANMLFQIGLGLTQQGEALEEPASAPVAALAIEALDRVWSLVGSEPNPRLLGRLAEAYAKALLTAGRHEDAAVHAKTAWETAHAIDTDEDTKVARAALQERCRTAAASPAPQPPAMICDGDSCRLVSP